MNDDGHILPSYLDGPRHPDMDPHPGISGPEPVMAESLRAVTASIAEAQAGLRQLEEALARCAAILAGSGHMAWCGDVTLGRPAGRCTCDDVPGGAV